MSGEIVHTDAAPKPVGAYPHARRVGNLLFLSGIGPRSAKDNSIPGGPIKNPDGSPRDYDVRAQTRAVIANVKAVLEASGSSFDRIVNVTVFLVNMERDFAAYNEIWAEHFTSVQSARTTIAITALPTPIAVEFQVTATVG